MNKVRNVLVILLPLMLFIIALIVVYPFYQYCVDPDAVAYITISKKYAAGDIDRAVNGYWSPLSCWLSALLIQQHVEAFKAGIIVNAMAAMCFLIASHFLFIKFITRQFLLLFLNTTIALFLVYAVFKQSFADLWAFFFLLLALQIMMKEGFLKHPALWIILGLVGSCSYMAKAYAFPYFILSTLMVVALLVWQQCDAFNYKKWLGISTVVLISLFIFSFPWLWMLHEKYGRWMTSTAGSLNLSWYLIGHPNYKDTIDLLVPPGYADAIYYWEDPYLVNADTPHFWNSPRLFLLQIIRVCYNILKLVSSMNEISCFFLPMGLFAIAVVFIRRFRDHFPPSILILSICFLLFPLGYMLINFEARYLWFLLPVSLVFGAIIWEKVERYIADKRLSFLLLLVFCFSYMAFPVLDMKAMYRLGEREYLVSKALSHANIKGTFASNIAYGDQTQDIARIAYFTDNPLYFMPLPPENRDQLLSELKRYNVRYYFHFQPIFSAVDYELKDENNKAYPLVFTDSALIGLKVYQVNR